MMRGLLVKDIKLMKNMKNSILMTIVITIGMGAYIKNTSFLVTYLSLIGATFTTSTLSYDEFDNGYAFLLSLPVTRKSYVVEKYMLGLILGGGGWGLGTVISTMSGVVRNTSPVADSLMMSLMLLPFTLLLLAILLPFHLKFGGEKGRIVMIMVLGAIFGIVAVGAKLAGAMQIDLDAALDNLSSMGMGVTALCALVIGAIMLLLSCRISIGIMNKKEF